MENILDVVAENGVPFRIILVDGKDEQIVKVYDRRYEDHHHGRFTGGSAYISEILCKDSGSGWNLYLGVNDWVIDPATFRLVRDWLYHYTY